MSKKQKKVCTTLNYIALFLIGITNPAVGWKTCAITAGIKKYKSIIEKKKKIYDKVVLLAKT